MMYSDSPRHIHCKQFVGFRQAILCQPSMVPSVPMAITITMVKKRFGGLDRFRSMRNSIVSIIIILFIPLKTLVS